MGFQTSSLLEGSVAEDNSPPAIIHETWEKEKKQEQEIAGKKGKEPEDSSQTNALCLGERTRTWVQH